MPSTFKELVRAKQELEDEAAALVAVMEGDEDLSPEQEARFDELTRTDDDNPGLIIQAQGRCDRQAKFDEHKKQFALSRLKDAEDLSARTAINAPVRARITARPRISKLTAYTGEDGDQHAYHVGMWLRCIKARCMQTHDERAEEIVDNLGWGIRAAQTEGDSSAGGYLVPEPLAAAIIDNREMIGITRRICDVVPMSSETQDIPKVNSGLTVYAPGEGGTLTASDAAYDRIRLTAVKRGVLNHISSELSEDALVNMTDRATMEMARALALQEDSELIDGDGTSTYFRVDGLLNKQGSAGVFTQASGNTWAALTLADVVNTFGKLPSQYAIPSELRIICSHEFYWQVLMRLAAAGGGNTLVGLQAGPTDAPTFMGVPVIFTARMPVATATATVSMLYGNFRAGVLLGDRSGVRIGLSTEFKFDEDLLSIRAISRYDINVHEPGTASAAGAYTGLKTGS